MGQSAVGKQYRYIDNSLLQYGINYYYKIVDVSTAGSRKEHAVKWIRLSEPGLFTQNARLTGIAPNPAVNDLNFSFELKKGNYISVELYTLTGQLVATPIQHTFYEAGGYNRK